MPAKKFPTLETKRLTLRAPTLKDAAAFQAMMQQPGVTRFSNWPDAPSKTEAERSMRWMAKLHASGKGAEMRKLLHRLTVQNVTDGLSQIAALVGYPDGS